MPLKSAQVVLAMPDPSTAAQAFSPDNSRHENLAPVTDVNLPHPEGLAPLSTAGCWDDGTGSLHALLGSAGHAASTPLLFERGADMAMRDERGQDAPYIACATGPTEIAAQLRGQC